MVAVCDLFEVELQTDIKQLSSVILQLSLHPCDKSIWGDLFFDKCVH